MKLLFIPFLLLGSGVVFGQMIVGLTGGINFFSINQKFNNQHHLRTFIPRINIGLFMQTPLNEEFSISSGLLYNGKGCRYGRTFLSRKPDSIIIHLNYIEIPIEVNYVFKSEKRQKIKLGGGVYVGYGFKGSIAFKNDPSITQKPLHKSDGYFNRLDFGLSFNTHYDLAKRISLSQRFSYSVLNIERDSDKSTSAKNLGSTTGVILLLR